jgi:hypothetical protein
MSDQADIKLHASIDFLNSIKKPSAVVDDPRCYSCIVYIKSSLFVNRNTDLTIFIEKKFHEFISEMLNYLAALANELDLDTYVASKEESGKNTTRIELLFMFLSLVNVLVCKSIRFNQQINKTAVIVPHLMLLKSDTFINKCLKNKCVYFLEFLVANINWLSRYCGEEARRQWAEMDAVPLLLKISKLEEGCILSAFQALSNICTSQQIENMDPAEITFGLKSLIKTMKSITNSFAKNKPSIIDGTIEVMINDESFQRQAHFIVGNGRQSVFGIIQALYKLAANDKIKEEIFFNYKIKEDLRIILNNSFNIEKRLTVKFIANLSFNAKIGADLVKDKEYMAFINGFISEDAKNKSDTPEEPKSCHKTNDIIVKHYG